MCLKIHPGLWTTVVALSAYSCPPSAAAEGPLTPHVFAVVVGHNDGWGVLPRLRFADDDALRFYHLATRLADKQNVALLTELDVETWQRLQHTATPPPPFLPPTKRKLGHVIKMFKRRIAALRRREPKRPVHLLFFFSGHGEEGYFFLKKTDRELAKAAFTGDDLRRAFADSEATLNGLFIDACKSQSLFVDKGPKTSLGPDFSTLIKSVEQTTKGRPIGVLTSTLSDRPAAEARDIGGGYFSHVLISGLAGAADANSDGVVRYNELAAFVTFHTRRVSGQQPWFRPPAGRMQAEMVRLSGRNDLIEILPGIDGHFAVFDERDGSLRLEVHKTKAQWTRLILEPGRYRVVWIRSRAFGLQARATIGKTRGVRLMQQHFNAQVSLASVRVKKGPWRPSLKAPAAHGKHVTSRPTSLPARPTADRSIAHFDPANGGFDQPFSSRVVTMLQSAYTSGLQATRARARLERARPKRSLLSVSYGYAGSLTRTYGHAHGANIAYHRALWQKRRWSFHLGARALFSASSHRDFDGRGTFSLQQISTQLEGYLRYGVWERLAFVGGIYLGWQLLLVETPVKQRLGLDSGTMVTALTGDPLSSRAGATAGVQIRMGPAFHLLLSIGVGLDLARESKENSDDQHFVISGNPQLLAGVGYGF